MSLSAAQKGLNVISWIHLIAAILTLILMIVVLVTLGNSELAQQLDAELSSQNATVTTADLKPIVAGGMGGSVLVSLLSFWLCKRAAKSANKVMPIFILSCLSVAGMIATVLMSGVPGLMKGTSWFTIVINVLTFIFALFVWRNRDERA